MKKIFYINQFAIIAALLLSCGSTTKKAEPSSASAELKSAAAESAELGVVKFDFYDYYTLQKGSFTDLRDNKTYKTIVIGNQTWMAENLNYEAPGSKCYDNDPDNCAKYGRLYSWATAVALPANCDSISCVKQIQQKHRGICPDGWFVPSNVWHPRDSLRNGWRDDWGALVDATVYWNELRTEMLSYAEQRKGILYLYEANFLKAIAGWDGEDIYGFNALPAGLGYPNGSFGGIGNHGYWWSTREHAEEKNDKLVYDGKNAGGFHIGKGSNMLTPKTQLRSIRCVSEKIGAETREERKAKIAKYVAAVAAAKIEAYKKANMSVFTDSRDQKNYKAVKIGNQTWMAENLNFDAKDSKCYDEKPENCDKYGRLYDWQMAMKACPKGWHLPTKSEWEALRNFLNVGGVGDELKSTNGWRSAFSRENGNGKDRLGFTALPGGKGLGKSMIHKGKILSYFSSESAGAEAYWWSAGDNTAYCASIRNSEAGLKLSDCLELTYYSVRCMKD